MRADMRWVVPGGLLISMGSCVSCPIFATSMSPGWDASFEIENLSGEPVHVAPVGVNRHGDRETLPRYYSSPPPLTPAIDRGNILLAPRQSVNITFDYDFINFSALLVQETQGGWYKVDVLPDPASTSCCGRPAVRHVAIPPLEHLARAEQPLVDAAARTRFNHRAWLYYALLVGGPLFVVLGASILVARKALGRKRGARLSVSEQG